jgi:hypothetical protein
VESVLQESSRRIRACETFDELHGLIQSEINQIDGVGPLLVYDATTTLGAHLGLNPDRIYLHAGTAVGAKALLSVVGRSTIMRSELPPAFLRPRCYEVENCLCIYKDELARIDRRKKK